MSKTLAFQVTQNRLQFKCPKCGARRNMAILPNLRRKRITCHKCAEATNCILNRRAKQRESQIGKAVLLTGDNKEIEITLHDISPNGVGFDLPPGNPRILKISPGIHFRIRCSWNAGLFGSNSYEVKSIAGRRVGAKRL